jgi:hypothetical protein
MPYPEDPHPKPGETPEEFAKRERAFRPLEAIVQAVRESIRDNFWNRRG